MATFLRYVLAGALTLVVFVVLASGGLVLGGDGESTVEVIRTAVSPDGARVARAYVVAGGGAAGFAYLRVDLRARAAPFRADRSYVLSMKADPYDARLSWRGPRELLVEYPPGAAIGGERRMEAEKDGVRITYTPTYRPDSAGTPAATGAPAT